MSPSSLDLTPFGFTPTESQAYRTLLDRGPLNGYALGRALSIARANAYQALYGLHAKGAVEPTGDTPKRYRPILPEALLARIVADQASRMDILEAELSAQPAEGVPVVQALSGNRALKEMILRTAGRSREPVHCLGPGWLLEEMAPLWHKRAADGSPTGLWPIDGTTVQLPVPPAGRPSAAEAAQALGQVNVLLVSGSVMVVATVASAGEASGYWSNHPILLALARAAMGRVTSA